MYSTFEFADHVVGILINDDVDKKLIGELHKLIAQKIKDHGRINLFVEITASEKVSFQAFMKDLSFKIKHSGDFQKIAVVTDLEWFRAYTGLKDLFLDAEVRSFTNNERLEAINWISH